MFRRFDLLYNQLSAVQDGALSGAYTEVFRNDAWVVFATNSEWSVRGQRAW